MIHTLNSNENYTDEKKKRLIEKWRLFYCQVYIYMQTSKMYMYSDQQIQPIETRTILFSQLLNSRTCSRFPRALRAF